MNCVEIIKKCSRDVHWARYRSRCAEVKKPKTLQTTTFKL